MDISTAVISDQIPYREAKEQFVHYRSLLKEKRATPDDAALYKALRALMRGQKVIDIQRAVIDGGYHEDGLPYLAVARADWGFLRCWTCDGRYVFAKRDRPWSETQKLRELHGEVRVRPSERPQVKGSTWWDIAGKAQVPMVPPQFRPKESLRNFHILFEAEWQRVPPTDPLLLKFLGGPFFVVLAGWDLTPLEQAVLRQKL